MFKHHMEQQQGRVRDSSQLKQRNIAGGSRLTMTALQCTATIISCDQFLIPKQWQCRPSPAYICCVNQI